MKEINADAYTRIPVDDLVLYAVKRVLDSGEECTFERLVYECFTVFPKQFSLQRYPQWPDSERVNKSWRRCRTDKGWLAGSVKEGFRLTPKGDRIVGAVGKKLALGTEPTKRKRAGRPRERYEAVLREIRETDAFRRYQSNPESGIPESEFRSVLGGTLETPIRILKQNLHFYSDVAEQYKDEEVARFLEACKPHLDLLSSK